MYNNPLHDVPEISFVPTSVEEMLDEMITDYEKSYFDITGEKIKIQPASETRIFLYTQAYRYYLAYMMIDNGLKMNLLKYSKGDFLDNLGAWFGLKRNDNKPSYATVEFTLSAPRQSSVTIFSGTRVSTDDNIFFKVIDQVIIPPGEISVTTNVVSVNKGAKTNSIAPGDINIVVDPIPFVSGVINISKSQGGADTEDDDSYRTRIYYYPDRFSTAGPEDAYIYFARSFSQSIEGIKVHSPEPGHVDIRVTLEGGELPEQAFLDELYNHLNDRDIRPLTDFLSVRAPDKHFYDIDMKYYIASSKYSDAALIQEKAAEALKNYIKWQSAEIGRDITPDMLVKLLIEAGVKRVEITRPFFEVVSNTDIAVLNSEPVINFGGLEND